MIAVIVLARKRRLLGILLGLIGLFILMALSAHAHLLVGPEGRIFRAVNNLPNAYQSMMQVVTQFGSEAMVLVVLVISLWKKGRLFTLQMALAAGATYMLVGLSKILVARPRPYVYLSDVHVRVHESGMGFPSGHTAITTALSVYLAWKLGGKWKLLPFVWVPVIGFSRLYLGVHLPLDLLGGITIGLAVIALQKLLTPYIVHHLSNRSKHHTK